MQVRCISKDELKTFINSYPDKSYRNWIDKLLEKKETKPEWCFVGEEDDKFLGKIVYFQFQGEESMICAVGLDLPWEGDYIGVGEGLLTKSFKELKSYNFIKIEIRCDTGDEYYQNIIALCEKVGCNLIQDKISYVLTDFNNPEKERKRLVFKSLDEVGEEKFIRAIKSVTEKTLDRVDKQDVELLGAEQAAREYFNVLKSIDFNEKNWVLGYDKQNNLVGLVVAQNFSEKAGCINYIGVVPEFRGNNYSFDLSLKATQLLSNSGSMKKIIADIDTQNIPLEKTLQSLKYQKTEQMWVYHKYL